MEPVQTVSVISVHFWIRNPPSRFAVVWFITATMEVSASGLASGGFGIRPGIWNLLTFQTGGGRDWNPQKINREEPVGQLYNLAEDLGEQNNLYIANPEIVEKLQKMLRKIKANGYSN